MGGELGELPCHHIFCFDCIHKWSKKDTVCPLCRVKFNFIDKNTTDPLNKEKPKQCRVPIRRKPPNRRVRFFLPADEMEAENRRIRMQIRQQMITDLRNERVTMNRFYFQSELISPCPGYQSNHSPTSITTPQASSVDQNDDSHFFAEALDILRRGSNDAEQPSRSIENPHQTDESWIDQLIENL
eukprot:gene13362-14685_t